MPLKIVRQDITKMTVDAIVNTTNEEMIGYSGVDFAVHEAAGPELDDLCKTITPLGLGMAKITPGFKLKAKHIIHTSGPIWQGGLQGESIILKSCYIESLKLAVDNGFETIAFPLISSGTYGYPKERVLKFAVEVITEFLYNHELTVYLCVFDRTSYEFSKELFDDIADFISDDNSEQKEIGLCSSMPSYEADVLIEKSCDFSIDSSFRKETPIIPHSEIKYSSVKDKTLQEYMKAMDKSFAFKLFDLIDRSGMSDVECYKKANIDKKTFSKIKCNPKTYKPSKQTAVAFAIALELDLEETQDLLASAGLTLSRSFTFDKIIRYFIQKEIYDIFEINEALFEFDQVLLGC